jgi:hypothetical protein
MEVEKETIEFSSLLLQIIEKDFASIHSHFKKLEEDDSEKCEKYV